ncbi:hypothetical protein KSP40_PGU017798 [Platanthera guangdongensis]|uniref:Uncharacterized protein n=1 Tax=Platanthera guangdongensis TaxID=2320717 RepID=A0ABR2M7P2_9ASPA
MAGVDVVSISSRSTIKPSSATPPHLRTWKLSMIDQLVPNVPIPFILFYSPSPSHPPAAILAHLKLSLSGALTKFYPLAGRLDEPTSTIDCGDQGVQFLEAQAPGVVDLAALLLMNPGTELRRQLVPSARGSTAECPGGALLAVQATVFNCGGVSLGLSISHKIADGVSYISFLQSWADSATTGGGEVVLESGYFPPLELLLPEPDRRPTERTVQRRFVLDGPQLTALRSASGLYGATTFPTPTR